MIWTDDAKAELQRLWAAGRSTKAIGDALGVSKNAVVGKAHRLDLPARPSSIGARGPRTKIASSSAPVRSGTVSGRQATSMRFRDAPTLPPLPPAPPALPSQPPAIVAPPPRPAAPPPLGRVATCCWPMGEPGTRGFRFCDGPPERGRPYCTEHCRIAYPHRGIADAA